MVRVLVLLASVIDGISYERLLSLISSLPDCNDDFGFQFDGPGVAGSAAAAGSAQQFAARATSAAGAHPHAHAACRVSGR